MSEDQEREGVLQSELVKELGLRASEMTAIRRKHLASHDWWKGEGGRIWITPDGEQTLRIFAECRDDAPQVIPKYIDDVKVHSMCPNPRFCRILVDHGERGITKEDCALPRRLQGRNLTGKTIRVEVVRNVTGVAYRHEACSSSY